MTIEIVIPTMGESVTEATVSRILKSSGTLVKQDEEILELETDKVNQVLYAPSQGILHLQVKEGAVVKVGQKIGSIEPSSQAPEEKKLEPAPPLLPEVKPPSSLSCRSTQAEFIQSLKAPVEKTSKEEAPPHPGNRKKMSAIRRTIAQKLVEVKNTTAMLTTFNEVDMTQIMALRAQEKERFQATYGVKLGFVSFFIKAAAQGLKMFPQVGAYIDKDEIVFPDRLDMGVAVSTEKGLIVPVIRSCDSLTFSQIEKEVELFAQKAREGSIGVGDLRGGCFTITNGGVFGSLLSTPILNPPQSAILGMHAIVKRAVVVHDQIVIRPMMYLALSYDHRIIDGKEAVQFLIHIKEQLEDPARLGALS